MQVVNVFLDARPLSDIVRFSGALVHGAQMIVRSSRPYAEYECIVRQFGRTDDLVRSDQSSSKDNVRASAMLDVRGRGSLMAFVRCGFLSMLANPPN